VSEGVDGEMLSREASTSPTDTPGRDIDGASPDAGRARARRGSEAGCRDDARGEGGDGRHVSYAERCDVGSRRGGHARLDVEMPRRLTARL
jgi:hypothetical protein